MRRDGESVWVWIRRGLGVGGFLFVLVMEPNLPLPFYAILGGLLGLPDVLIYQWQLNRERKRENPSE